MNPAHAVALDIGADRRYIGGDLLPVLRCPAVAGQPGEPGVQVGQCFDGWENDIGMRVQEVPAQSEQSEWVLADQPDLSRPEYSSFCQVGPDTPAPHLLADQRQSPTAGVCRWPSGLRNLQPGLGHPRVVYDRYLACKIAAHLSPVGVPCHSEVDAAKIEPSPHEPDDRNQQ